MEWKLYEGNRASNISSVALFRKGMLTLSWKVWL